MRVVARVQIKIELVAQDDATKLFEFECQNRVFFEKWVPTRGEAYYEFDSFCHILSNLLQDQAEGKDYFHLIRDEHGTILGRINIVDIQVIDSVKSGHIGYRIGESHRGRGIASDAVRLLVQKAVEEYYITLLYAKTTMNNLASQKVLEKNHFLFVTTDHDQNESEPFRHYVWNA
nr:GNAT family N-acetyltransferase [Brevibacillus invocatus]